jgi:uncharacterized protein (TIGR02246 family)
MTEEERAIREVIATWMRASAEGDTETVLSLMAENVVFFVPGHPPFGKAEFAAAQEGLRGSRIEADSTVREVRIFGDWAWCSTDLTVVMTSAGGGAPVRRSGNTLSIFRRLPDGRWVLARDANLLAVER